MPAPRDYGPYMGNHTPTYDLRKDTDGLTYIYADGIKHSRFGLLMEALSPEHRAVLDDVMTMLNQSRHGLPVARHLAAYSMYRQYLW